MTWIASWPLRGTRCLLATLGVTGCCALGIGDCPDPPTAAESECWGHVKTSAKAPSCDDDDEPNDTLPMARDIPVSSCTPMPMDATLSGDDVDIFHAGGSRCDSSPHLHLATSGVRACLFVQCRTGSTGSSPSPTPKLCSDGVMAKRHPSGLLGCCLDKPGDVDLDVVCSTTKKDLDAYIVVDGASAACTKYEFTFHL